MTTYLNFLIESSICITVFYVVYRLLFEREKLPQLNRLYLMTSIVFSLVIPLINITLTEQSPFVWDGLIWGEGIVPTMEQTTLVQENNLTITWIQLIGLVYSIGVSLMLIKVVRSYASILRLIKSGNTYQQDGFTLVMLNEDLPVFSFFNYIFLGKEYDYSSEEASLILAHERAHIEGLHTIDILLMELVKVIFWFLPFVYQYQNKLREVHEYLADAAVIDNHCTPLQYASLVMQEARRSTDSLLPLTHSFHYQTKNRLIMIGKSKKPIRGFKMILSVPVFMVLFLSFSVTGDVFGQQQGDYKEVQKDVWVGTTPAGDFPPNAIPGHCYTKCLKDNNAQWVEVPCPSRMTYELIDNIMKGLASAGFEIDGKPTVKRNHYVLPENGGEMLRKYQEKNELPVGGLNLETLASLNIEFSAEGDE